MKMKWMDKKIGFEAIAIFIVVYPFLILPWNQYFVTFTKLVHLIIFITVLWGIYVFHWVKHKHPIFVPKTKGEIFAFAFFFLACLSTLFAADPKISFFGVYYKYQGLISRFSYITLFIFFFHLFPIKKQVKYIKWTFFASFFFGIYGIIQHLKPNWLVGATSDTRHVFSWPFFDNPNHFGSYLAIMIILGMTVFLLAKNRRQCVVYWAIICTLFVSLLYTMTRGAWLATFLGCLLLTVLVVRKYRRLWTRWFILLLSLVIIFQFVNLSESNHLYKRGLSIGSDLTTAILTNNGEAGATRWSIWKRSLPLIKEHYLLGTGPNSFAIAFPLTDLEKRRGIDNSHNDYIETAFTMGVPALLIYLGFIFTILKNGFSALRKIDEDNEIFLSGLMTAIISYLIKVFFNVSVVSVAPFFWALLGMSYAFSNNIETDP